MKRKEAKDTEASGKGERRESNQKENMKSVSAGAKEKEEEEEGKLSGSDKYRGKQLPPGMKVKKRVSDEERKATSEDDAVDRIKESHNKQRDAEKTSLTSSVKAAHAEKINLTSQELTQQPSTSEPCQDEKTDPSKSTPSSTTNTARHSASNKPMQPGSSQTKNHQDNKKKEDNDDDDVVLVSVKPAIQKTPPVSTVQKTLTTFPGFQPASEGKGLVPNPKGMHSLLTAQLQQKKVRK